MQIASKRRDHRCAMQTVILLKSINNKDDKNLLGRRRSRELVFHRIVILICTSRSPQGLIWILLLNLKQDLRNTISSNTLECEKQRCVELSSTYVCFRLLQSTTKLLLELVFKIERWKSTCSSHSKKSVQPSVNPLCSECAIVPSIFTTAKRRCSRQRKIFDPPSSTSTEQYIPKVMTSLLLCFSKNVL